MNLSQRMCAVLKSLAVIMALALPLTIAVSSSVDARIGGGSSSGSRGSRTFSAPPTTRTAPNAAQPMQRTITQPGVNSPATAGGGFFNRPGMGLLGGLPPASSAPGLLGMLFGGGLFGGLGGLSSFLGLIIQLALIYFVVRLAMSWWQRRNAPALCQQCSAGHDTGKSAVEHARRIRFRPRFRQRAAEHHAGRLRHVRAHARRSAERVVERGHQPSAYAGNAGDGVLLHAGSSGQQQSRPRQSSLRRETAARRSRRSRSSEGPTDYATLGLRFSLVDRRSNALAADCRRRAVPVEVTEVWILPAPQRRQLGTLKRSSRPDRPHFSAP